MECETFGVESVVVLHLDIRHIGKKEYNGEDDDDNPDGSVRDPEHLGARALSRGVL